MKQVQILDTLFEISSVDPQIPKYIDRFTAAYDAPMGSSLNAVASFAVIVSTGDVPHSLGGEYVKVHANKHEYWDLDGEYLSSKDRRTVLWRKRRLLVEIDSKAKLLRFTFPKTISAAFAGESLFHALRGIAIFHRSTPNTNFLHASCVTIGGRAVIFTGADSSGKTTMMLKCITGLGATPLSNDRVLLQTTDTAIIVHSWPSYASFCEGTILDYNELAKGTERYESDPPVDYRTVRWQRPLERRYDKRCKRFYPMEWFSECFGRRFVRAAELQVVVFCNLDVSCATNSLHLIDPQSEAGSAFASASLAAQLFDGKECNFKAWHGFKPPTGSPDVEQLVANLIDGGIKLFRLHASPLKTDTVLRQLRRVLAA